MKTEQNNVDLVSGDVVHSFARAALLAALLGAVAPVSIPIPLSPAPITLQPLFIYLAGLLLGPVWGTVSLVLYLTAGAIGLPVFAGMKGGLGVLVGTTAGYLWSYPLAALLIGLLVHRGTDLRNPANVSLPIVISALVVATLLIYAMGVSYMAWVLGPKMTLVDAVFAGALPFIPGEILKMAAAIAVIKSKRITAIRS